MERNLEWPHTRRTTEGITMCRWAQDGRYRSQGDAHNGVSFAVLCLLL